MANAINTRNPVATTQFIVNKYEDIDGSRVAGDTPRGRLCYRGADGRMHLPQNYTDCMTAVYPVDWAKPLNPPPYFDGQGLNGTTLYPFNDGSLDNQESAFAIDPDTAFMTPWPAAIKTYEIPPQFYGLPVTSGNRALVYDEGTFTYGSGNYTGVSSDYHIGDRVYASFNVGSQGMLTTSGVLVVGTVEFKDVFGQNTITVKMRGTNALSA